MGPYLKAVVGSILAGLGAAGTAATDGSISLAEGIVIATAFFGTLYGVWAAPNKP